MIPNQTQNQQNLQRQQNMRTGNSNSYAQEQNFKPKNLNIRKTNQFIILTVHKLIIMIVLALISLLKTNSLLNTLMITNSTNQHGSNIFILKSTSNYKTIFSVQTGGILKIWNFTIPILTLSQQINLGQNFNWYTADALFLWNDGQRIYVGGSSTIVKIFYFDNITKLYTVPAQMTPSVGGSISSIWVSTDSNRMYLGLSNAVKRYDWDGTNWIQNTPPILTSTVGAQFTPYIALIQNQNKILLYDDGPNNIRIFKFNGSQYVIHQNFYTGYTSFNFSNCRISFNQQYLNCYAGKNNTPSVGQYNNFYFDSTTDMFVSVSKLNDFPALTYDSFMDSNDKITILQYNTKTIYRYQFTMAAGGAYSYTPVDQYTLANGKIASRIASQRQNSQFQLISTLDGEIHLLYGQCNNTALIPNCLLCSPNNNICLLCQEGYNLTSGRCNYCLIGYYVNGSICSSCGINCFNCSSLTTCRICVSGWALSNIGVCDTCEVGKFLNGTECDNCGVNCDVCTNDTTCITCKSGFQKINGACCSYGTLLCNSNGTSSSCKRGFTLKNSTCLCLGLNMLISPDNQTCDCPLPNKLISNICDLFNDSSLMDCLSVKRLPNGTLICMFCAKSQHKVLLNDKCVCQVGFHDPFSNGTCQQICGDGLVFSMQCDDNNTLSKDGCSSSCSFQSGFNCFIESPNPTFCQSKIILKYSQKIIIFKDEQQPKAKLTLKILNNIFSLPYLLQKKHFVQQILYLRLVLTNPKDSSQIIQIKNHKLININSQFDLQLQFPFEFTIQNYKAKIYINYQNTQYYNYTQQIPFSMKGKNLPLIFSSNMQTYKSLSTVNFAGIVLSSIILILSLFTSKFIGLEMILTLQLIFFSQMLIYDTQKWPAGFIYLKNFKFATGYNDFVWYSQYMPEQVYTTKLYNLEMKKMVVENFNMNYLIIVFSFILALIMFLIRTSKQRQLSNYKLQAKSNPLLKNQQQVEQTIKSHKAQISFYQNLNQKSFHILTQISFWLTLPIISAIAACIFISNQYIELKDSGSINNSNRQNVVSLQKFIAFSAIAIIFFILLNNFINIWLTRPILQRQYEKYQQIQYKCALFIYLLLIGSIILFYNNLTLITIPISFYALIIHIAFIITLIKLNPYRQCLHIHTITLFINQFVYLIFLIIINLINFVDSLDETIILLLGYFITLMCWFIIGLSVVRLYYQFRYGERLEIQVQKERQEEKKLQQKIKKQNLQKDRQRLQYQASQKLNQQQKLRYQNPYIFQNQLRKQQQKHLIQWLANRNCINQQQKQKQYYKLFHQKPIQWMKQNNIKEYNNFMEERRKVLQHKKLKMQERTNDTEYSRLVRKLSRQYKLKNRIDGYDKFENQDQSSNMLYKKLRNHEKKLQRRNQVVNENIFEQKMQIQQNLESYGFNFTE